MNYAESLDYVCHAKQAGAVKNGLVNITELLKRLGNPEARFPSVHVAGTNGKGSVCAFVESIARRAGYRTGLFTSPYLERFTERIRVGGEEIAGEEFAAAASTVRQAVESMARDGLGLPTFFELVTACGFLHFARRQVELAVVETGLGGRTDATNVLLPELSVITTIGIDHASSLGGTLEKIAAEKAGIIKPGVPCVLSGANSPAAAEVIRRAAEQAGSAQATADGFPPMPARFGLDGQEFSLQMANVKMDGLRIGLLGDYQIANAATAVQSAMELKKIGYRIDETHIREGLAAARWPGRMEVLRREPPFLIDGAHNPQGAEALASTVKRYLPGRPVCLVAGAMADKDAEGMADHFTSFASRAIVTLPPTDGRERYSAGKLAICFAERGVQADVREDWRLALDAACDCGMAVVVAGSIYLAGAARTWFLSLVAGAGYVL